VLQPLRFALSISPELEDDAKRFQRFCVEVNEIMLLTRFAIRKDVYLASLLKPRIFLQGK